MRCISEILGIRIYVKKKYIYIKNHLPQAGLACLPVQEEGPGRDWHISLLRTGLSSCSGRGSLTGLAFLSAQEQGLGLDWPPCSRRGTWTLQEPILCSLSQPFRAYINKSSFKIMNKYKHVNIFRGQSDTKNIKHQWANTFTNPIKKSF